MELNQEKVKVSTIQSELNLKNDLVEDLENQILSLSQALRKQPTASIVPFQLTKINFSKHGSNRQLVCASTQTQTDIKHINRFEKISMNSLDRTASHKNLHS
jgi:hypothetical protein